MKLIDSNLACPACRGTLRPKVLECPVCEIKLEGPFQLNEFATLAQEDLHFLRVFLGCEGRVRDMESALGLSYPTIRSRLSALKTKILGDNDDDARAAAQPKANESPAIGDILKSLQAGEIPFDEAMKKIKLMRGKP